MLEQSPQNKMMEAPPAKKGFHFASDGVHFAEFIEAETIDHATAIYHKVKRLLFPPVGSTSPSAPIEQQSPSAPESEEETNG